jgi:hypothetical protein
MAANAIMVAKDPLEKVWEEMAVALPNNRPCAYE